MNILADIDKAYSLHPFTHLSNHQKNTSLGFSETRLIDAASRQFAELPFSHLFTHRSTKPAIELSQKLVELAPGSIAKAFLVNSGSEAVDTAIKMAWYYNNARGKPTKKTIISRKRAYHGVTIAAGSLTGLPYVQDGFDLPAIPVVHVDTPHAYRYSEAGESEEAVMGAGGVMIPPAGYFQKVQAILKKHDILFIADEVICGFGRTGQVFGCDTFDIEPDIMTIAKQLSSAYLPIGAVLVTDKLYDAFEAYSDKLGMFGTGNTYGGHPVAAAVALETLKIYENDGIYGRVKALSPQFAERVQALQNHPLVGNARSVGLIGAIELVKDKHSKEPFPAETKIAVQVMAAAREHGLILRAVPGDTVAFCPPLIINEEQIDTMFDAVSEALNDVLKNQAT